MRAFSSSGLTTLWTWPARSRLVALIVSLVAAVLSGIPTGMIPTNLFYRMTPVLWWDYPVWVASATLFGLLVGSYFTGSSAPSKSVNRPIAGEFASTIAVGCPICNKVVVAVLGVSGAMNIFAPIQPVLGVLSVAFMFALLLMRLRAQNTACPVAGPKHSA